MEADDGNNLPDSDDKLAIDRWIDEGNPNTWDTGITWQEKGGQEAKGVLRTPPPLC